MANPIRIFFVPSVGLEFDCVTAGGGTLKKYGSSGQDPIRYKLSNLLDRGFSELLKPSAKNQLDDKQVEGWMSPISAVTLPAATKKLVGIHEKAKYFAYIHPPEGLAEMIDWEKVDFRHDSNLGDLYQENKWAMPFCSVLGAYAYFTDDSLIQVNALSMLKTQFVLDLAGPFKVTKEAKAEMRELNRVHPLSSEVFYENSFVAFGATCPGEVFRSKNPTLENTKGMHGAFMFYRDDGSAICYEVDSSGYIDPSGLNSSLQDVFESLTLQSQKDKQTFGFISNYHLPDVGSEERLRKRIKRAYANVAENARNSFMPDGIARLLQEYPNTLIHEACRAQCDKSTMEKLIKDVDSSMLKYPDRIGWLPLHYACCHCDTKDGNSDFELIELILSSYPEAVTTPDIFNRCPLHIALNSRASVEVVDLLLQYDRTQKAIKCSTAILKRSLFHIACNRGVNKDVFERIMKADETGEMLTSKTELGCTPLQLAIESRLDHEIIKMLIAKQEQMVHTDDGIEVLDFDEKKTCLSTINYRFNGMIPLAHAVWNKSSPETIAVLLDHDIDNVTIDEEVVKDEASATSQVAMQDLDGMVPLHLALKHADAKVVALLLQKEKLRVRRNRYESTIFRRDKKMRCPLHIATHTSTDLSIVKELLAIDVKKETTRALDSEWCTPLHYASCRNDDGDNLVALLLKSEQRYLSILKAEEGMIPRSTDWKPADFQMAKTHYEYSSAFLWPARNAAHCLDQTNKSPLFHAVKSEADADVITELLRPEQFYLKKFDSLVDELAGILQKSNNAEMQGSLIDELSNRCYFCLMFFDITFHTIALGTFIYSSEQLIQGEISYAEVFVIWLCIGIGVLRELARFSSQHSSYFLDLWSWSEVICLVLLGNANLHFSSNIDVPNPDIDRTILTAAGALLVVNLVFFLRTTFLPFAKFVGGLIIILQTLIPFFIVSFLLLLAFAYSFRMSGTRGESCESLGSCYYTVLQAFFAGADAVEDYLDVLYGVIIIVVLLNVVIAIVEQAWSNAAGITMRLFWTYRLEFLTENRIFANKKFKLLLGLQNRIDDVNDVVYTDRTTWSKAPYNLVDSKAKYENPSGYFSPEIAQKIKETYSCQSSLYWVQHEYYNNQKEAERGSQLDKLENNAQLFWGQISVLVNFFGRFLIYSVLCVLGAVTCGWFWPRSLRRKMLSVGLSEPKEA